MTSALLIAALMVAAVGLLVMVFKQLHRKQQDKKTARQTAVVDDALAAHDFRVSQQEKINHSLFAIDEANAQLLHFNFRKPAGEATHINLRNMKTVNVDADETSAYEMKKGKKVPIEKQLISMELVVKPKNTSEPDILLPLYDYEDGLQDLGIIKKRGEHWRALINSCISNNV